MAEAHRRGTARERADAKAKALREARGVDAETVGQAAASAVTLLRVLQPPTIKWMEAELGRFVNFVKSDLIHTQAGKEVWKAWAGDRTVDELMQLTGKFILPSRSVQADHQDGTAPPMNVNIIQSFALWRVGGMRGRLKEAPMLESVEQSVDIAWAAYHRNTRVKPDAMVHTSVMAYIKTDLKDKFGLHEEKLPRRVPDRQVLIDIVRAILSPDLVNEYTCLRFHTLLTLNLQVASGSRIGAILRSTSYSDQPLRALQFGHTETWVFPTTPGRDEYNQILIRFKLIFTKTTTGKESSRRARSCFAADVQGREYPMGDADIPAFHGATMFLVNGLASGVYEGNPSLPDLLDPRLFAASDRPIMLTVKEEWRQQPVMRQTQVTMRDFAPDDGHVGELHAYCQLGESWRAGKYDGVLKDACHKAGYPISFASHDLRVLAVMASLDDDTVRLTDIQFSIGHSIASDKWTRYLNQVCRLDFQKCILGKNTTATEKLTEMSKMRVEKNPLLPTFLSQESKAAMYDDDELASIRVKQLNLKQELRIQYGSWRSAPPERQAAVRGLYLDYKAVEPVVYRKYLKLEVEAYLQKTNAINARRVEALAALEAVDIESQIDVLPDAAAVDHDLSLTAAVLTSTDFSRVGGFVELLGASDPSIILAQLAEGIESPAATATPSGTTGDTSIVTPATLGTTGDTSIVTTAALGTTGDMSIVTPATLGTTGDMSIVTPATLGTTGDTSIATTATLGTTGDTSIVSATPPGTTGGTATTATKRRSLGPTRSELAMPPPPLPALWTQATPDELIDPELLAISTPASGSSISPPKAVGTATSAQQVPRPSAKKAKSSLNAAAEAAQSRSRSMSVASSTSTVHSADTVQTESKVSVIDDDHIDSVTFAFDTLASAILDPSADRLAFFSKVLALPAKSSHVRGWWPGMTMVKVDGKDCCPRCGIDIPELCKGFKGLVPAAQRSKMKKHIFECTAAHIKKSSMPSILDGYDQAQPCCFCIAREGWSDLEGKHRTPQQWVGHLTMAHNAGDLCICGQTLVDTNRFGRLHLASHGIFAKPMLQTDPVPADFPEPSFSLRDHCFHADPVEWEQHCAEEFSLAIDAAATLPARSVWGVRDDLKLGQALRPIYRTACEELAYLSPTPPTYAAVDDGRFPAIVTDTTAKVVSKFGYCIFCCFDSRLSFTDRMKQHTHLSNMRKHILAHILNFITCKHRPAYVCRDSSDEEDDEDSAEHGESSVQGSESALTSDKSYTFANWSDVRWFCPDPSCTFHDKDINLRQLVNHVYLYHRAFDHGTVGVNCISVDDTSFVANLRVLFKNADLHKLAAQTAFPQADPQPDGGEPVAGPSSDPKNLSGYQKQKAAKVAAGIPLVGKGKGRGSGRGRGQKGKDSARTEAEE